MAGTTAAAAYQARLRPTDDAEWEGAARMAKARERAGIPLNGLDREALERCPVPPSGLVCAHPSTSVGVCDVCGLAVL